MLFSSRNAIQDVFFENLVISIEAEYIFINFWANFLHILPLKIWSHWSSYKRPCLAEFAAVVLPSLGAVQEATARA